VAGFVAETPFRVSHEGPMPSPLLSRIAFVGNFVPRRCGIATFTRDLRAAVAGRLPAAECPVIAMNDGGVAHAYPDEVRFVCHDGDPAAYRRAADFLNLANVDVVSLQHEFGIFGGPAGSHVLELLRALRVPIHTTLHTVLAQPSAEQRQVMEEVIRLSARIAVMTEHGRALVRTVYGVADDRVDVIPHGIPDMEFVDPAFHKDRFGMEGAHVLLTFGLLSPNKGIEHVIAALPRIVDRHPNTRYVVVGATHPHLVRQEGERYRQRLRRLTEELGVAGHVEFHDRFVDMEELLAFIGAADIYVTPYLNPDQITSGTLAYAFGCGKAVLSTPYWHASELLADGRGVLVPFRDAAAIAREVCGLLDDDARRHAMRKRAYLLGREMIWPRVAERYVEALRAARLGLTVKPRRPGPGRPARLPRRDLPPLRLEHLMQLTDSTGLLQHATYDVPNRAEGYCTDDNARALAAMVAIEELGAETEWSRRASRTFASFLGHAFDAASGRFRNFMAFDRRWLDDGGTDDCLGRGLHALGTCIGRTRTPGLQRWAMGIFEPALRAVMATTSPRAWSLAILGIQEYLRRLDGDRFVTAARAELSERLLGLRESVAGADWPWFEEIVAYENARPCQALISAGRWSGNAKALEAGLDMLGWLTTRQLSPSGRFSPIGCKGFLRRDDVAAVFDQQPIEAQATIAACIEAFHATGATAWLERAWNAFDWFHGHNVLGMVLCDLHTGGCRDGLQEDRANENQGAESTLAYVTALVDMKGLEAGSAAPADVRTRAEPVRCM
jgi:glycosyltransferase involved in cell wall biosynthesis